MSSRTYMFAVQSLDPIKNAIGSKDRALLEALLEALGDNEAFQSYANDMIMKSSPQKEPGCWSYLVEPLAKHYQLALERLPLDDWKHYSVWEEYRSIADPVVSAEARRLLQLLESGRAFNARGIDHDGCMFAWLTATEVKTLHAELAAINASDYGELDEFHEELVESLEQASNADKAVFLGAS